MYVCIYVHTAQNPPSPPPLRSWVVGLGAWVLVESFSYVQYIYTALVLIVSAEVKPPLPLFYDEL